MEATETLLYLVRHGATEANERVPYILQGSGIDLPLSARGREQAAALAGVLSTKSIAGVYSSGMQRARETAEAIARSAGREVTIAQGLHECDVGRWEGMDWESIRRVHPDAHRLFADNPELHPNLEGESYGDVFRRVHPVAEQLLERHAGSRFVMVAHNVVNRVLVAHLLGLEIRRAQSLRQGNGCINVIRRLNGKTELLTYNSMLHLS